MGKIVLWGAVAVLALVFLPGLLQGGLGGAKGAGGKAGDSIVDTAKDPQAVVDGAGSAIAPVKDAVTPWYEYVISQSWFIPALVCGIAAFLAIRLWNNMGHQARYIVVGVGVFAFVIMAIGLAK